MKIFSAALGGLLTLAFCMAAEEPHFYVAPAAPPDAAKFEVIPGPGIRYRMNEASATSEPWLDLNAWRYQRGLRKAKYDKLAAGTASLAAAEAFVFGADAILNPLPPDAADLEKMLAFLKTIDAPRLPEMANIGVIDDHSPAVPEVLNLLSRRNLLYRVVSAPDRNLNLNVKIGSPDFPVESTKNPSEFAARVREKLGDEHRLVRLYGTSTTTVYLTGDQSRARLYLLSYGKSRFPQTIRVRVLGHYTPVRFSGFETPSGAVMTDIEDTGDAAEFTIPAFTTLGVIDLEKKR